MTPVDCLIKGATVAHVPQGEDLSTASEAGYVGGTHTPTIGRPC
jgi:hypothetical protein